MLTVCKSMFNCIFWFFNHFVIKWLEIIFDHMKFSISFWILLTFLKDISINWNHFMRIWTFCECLWRCNWRLKNNINSMHIWQNGGKCFQDLFSLLDNNAVISLYKGIPSQNQLQSQFCFTFLFFRVPPCIYCRSYFIKGQLFWRQLQHLQKLE